MPNDGDGDSRARRARLAVGVTFVAHAAAFATWAARIPTIRDDLGLGTDDLGIALGGLTVGMFVGTRLTGRMERHARTGRPVRVVLPLLCLAVVGPALARDLVTLTLALAVLGLLGGLLDVIMNAHAVAVERIYQRPIMSGFHALWSIGTMIGSGVAALVARQGVDLMIHFSVVAVLLAVVTAVPARGVLPHDVEAATTHAHHRASAATRPPAGLLVVLLIGAMGLGSFLVEGAVADWSAVFMTDERGSPVGLAALALTVFSGSMAVSRLVGDRLGVALGPVRLGQVGGAVALAGFAVLLLVPAAPAGLVGFGLVGLGLGPVVPMVFSAAGNTATRGRPSVLGSVVSAGYIGGVVGPVLIGAVASGTSLSVALLLPVAFVVLILVAAPVLGPAAGGSVDVPASEPHVGA